MSIIAARQLLNVAAEVIISLDKGELGGAR
jgi:hypothetical protein